MVTRRRRRSLGLIGLAALLSAGCSEGTGATHVACVGDSITVGDGASAPQETYPAALQGMFAKSALVQMFGHSGATTLGPGVGDLPYESQPEYKEATTFVAGAGPDARVAVVLLMGTNDSKASNWDAHKGEFKAAFEKMIDHFASLPTHPTVYVATPLGAGKTPCCGIRGETLDKEIIPAEREIAQKRGLTVIDLTSIGSDPQLLVDGVHPNDKGYEELAAKVMEVLVAQPPKPQHPAGLLQRLGLGH